MSAAACGKSEEKTDTGSTTAGSQASSDEPVTLTIWNTEVLTPGIQTNEVAKEIEKKLGIKMEIVQGDAQKFSILVAGEICRISSIPIRLSRTWHPTI